MRIVLILLLMCTIVKADPIPSATDAAAKRALYEKEQAVEDEITKQIDNLMKMLKEQQPKTVKTLKESTDADGIAMKDLQTLRDTIDASMKLLERKPLLKGKDKESKLIPQDDPFKPLPGKK